MIFAGQIWKIATGGAALITVILSFMLATCYLQNRDLTKQRQALSVQISDPKTGYIAQLAQAHTNIETLKVEVDHQNEAYDKLSKDSQAQLAQAKERLAVAQADTKVMERKLAVFLTSPPQGDTLEQRIKDIDARATKEYLQ